MSPWTVATDIEATQSVLETHGVLQFRLGRVLGVLNFEPREIGGSASEVLILGVQYPGAASGEATFLTPGVEAKLGSKVF